MDSQVIMSRTLELYTATEMVSTGCVAVESDNHTQCIVHSQCLQSVDISKTVARNNNNHCETFAICQRDVTSLRVLMSMFYQLLLELMFFRTDSTDFPDCLLILLSISFFNF